MRTNPVRKSFLLLTRRVCSLTVLLSVLLSLSACQPNQPTPSLPSDTETIPIVDSQSPDNSSTSPEPPEPLNPIAPTEPSDPAEIATEPSPAPETTPDPTISPSPQEELPESYFDGSLFIGDSILEGIHQYVAKKRNTENTLGTAKFLTSIAGVSVGKLLHEDELGTSFYRYNGTQQPLFEILPQTECTRIFLLLGLNDLADTDPVIDNIVDDYSQLIDLLQQTVPAAEIIVITNPPKVASTWLPDYTPNRNFDNVLIAEFVDALTRMCNDRGIPYVDANTTLKDENGVLPDDYCRDGFVHLNDAGAELVVDELYRFAAEQF